MWVTRRHYETLVENVTAARTKFTLLAARLAAMQASNETQFEALTIERAKNSLAEARLAAMQATQDWLTLHVNRLENERRILTEARLGLLFPSPEISRSSERSSPSSAGTAEDDAEARLSGDVIHGLPHDALPLAQLMAASMEDVGDDEAAALGVSHDSHGFAVYRR